MALISTIYLDGVRQKELEMVLEKKIDFRVDRRKNYNTRFTKLFEGTMIDIVFDEDEYNEYINNPRNVDQFGNMYVDSDLCNFTVSKIEIFDYPKNNEQKEFSLLKLAYRAIKVTGGIARMGYDEYNAVDLKALIASRHSQQNSQ